jgi:peptidoglycan/LPS O-acetylase OafA/YrhL
MPVSVQARPAERNSSCCIDPITQAQRWPPAKEGQKTKEGERWIPALDGVRGLAILLVMLFHYSVELDRSYPFQRLLASLCGYGWTGVDLFFVLSGFLITGILVESRTADNYFSSFYARRVLRIFPAYYASLIVFFLILPALDHSIVRLLPGMRDRWLYVFYAQNLVGIFQLGGQFLLTPFWSLAVEEQFYLIWPLVVARFAGRKLLWLTCAGSISAVLIRFGIMAVGGAREAIYASTVTRMDSLLIGAACAVMVRDARWRERLSPVARWSWIAPVVPFLALRLTATSPKTLDPTVQGIGYTVVALSYAGLLLTLVLGGNSVLQRLFASRVMRSLGKYSYGAYLWHYVAMRIVWTTFARYLERSGPSRMLLMILITMLMSLASYHLVERWFLLLKKKFEPHRNKVARISYSVVAGSN